MPLDSTGQVPGKDTHCSNTNRNAFRYAAESRSGEKAVIVITGWDRRSKGLKPSCAGFSPGFGSRPRAPPMSRDEVA